MFSRGFSGDNNYKYMGVVLEWLIYVNSSELNSTDLSESQTFVSSCTTHGVFIIQNPTCGPYDICSLVAHRVKVQIG